MHRQIFIPSEQNNAIPFIVPREWYGKLIEFIAFPVNEHLMEEGKSYSYLQAEKHRQKQLIAEGKMTKPVLADDVFSPEEEADFERKLTIDDIYYGQPT
ncbi:MAG: hypothetical protein LBE82_03485 [Chitinophagaceae bacterium]|nr:hypothetical protein [Chitinophagaceae bacterium]